MRRIGTHLSGLVTLVLTLCAVLIGCERSSSTSTAPVGGGASGNTVKIGFVVMQWKDGSAGASPSHAIPCHPEWER
jgi:hypothetical protein